MEETIHPVGRSEPTHKPPEFRVTLIPVVLLATLFPLQPSPAKPEVCRAAPGLDAAAFLSRAISAIGLEAANPVLHFNARDAAAAREQSDRPYPPYLHLITDREVWFNTANSTERHSFDDTWPGNGRVRRNTMIMSRDDLGFVNGDSIVPAANALGFYGKVRGLNPWAVLSDWKTDQSVRGAGECMYRDYYRVVLERTSEHGPERLYLSKDSGLPVALAFRERHDLWGAIEVRYLYMNWKAVPGGGIYPGSSARIEDGESVIVRTVSGPSIRRVAGDSAPAIGLPGSRPGSAVQPASASAPASLSMVDTVRIGPTTFLLTNPAYNETVTMQRDTVYLLDATMNEARARNDSAWITRLFPRHRAIVLVVTDIAWPHIGGVRFWVARGASIVTHRQSLPLLQEVTGRRWTDHPDALEASRTPRGDRLRAKAINDSLTLAGGAIRLIDVGGMASEGALVAWIPADNYVWVGDYVQTVSQRSVYADDVNQALQRHRITPLRFAAQHLPMKDWAELAKVLQ